MDIENRINNLVQALENATSLGLSGGRGGQQYAHWNREFEDAKQCLTEDVQALEAELARLREALQLVKQVRPIPGALVEVRAGETFRF